jgi:hypothetical protein
MTVTIPLSIAFATLAILLALVALLTGATRMHSRVDTPDDKSKRNKNGKPSRYIEVTTKDSKQREYIDTITRKIVSHNQIKF